MGQTAEQSRVPLFTPRGLVDLSVKFVAVFLLAWGVSQGVKLLYKLAGVAEEIPSKWPLSLVETRLARKFPDAVHPWAVDLCIAVGILLLFFVFVRWLSRRTTQSMFLVVAAGFVFVLLTNLIHGPWYGLVYPHQGATRPETAVLQYYHDAAKITSAGQFLREFETMQPAALGCHSRTHPPGAVLFFYAVIGSVGHGAAVSVVIAALSVGLSGIFFYRVLARDFDRDTCGYVTLLLLLMPAVAVYYCASLDGIVAGCCLGVLLFLRHPNRPLSVAGMIVCLFCASFLTFAACFLLPVVAGFELLTKRSIGCARRSAGCGRRSTGCGRRLCRRLGRSAAVLGGVGVCYLLLYLGTGFNYFTSFRTASTLENPHGFLLLADPISYLMTRLENVGDLAVFFGPFLLVLSVRGMRIMREGAFAELFTLSRLGVLTLAAMFLTGAFRTGETARACLFIYPYLMFPVAACLNRQKGHDSDKRLLLWLVFGQALLMQTLAGYYW